MAKNKEKKEILKDVKTEEKAEIKEEQYKKVPEKEPAPTEEKMPSLKDILPDTYSKEDADAIEKYTEAVLGKFTRFIKSVVLFGSKKNKVKTTKTSDIDIAIIVDDTDVRRMSRGELKDKLFTRLLELAASMAEEIPSAKKLHPQPYLLTEFWQYTMNGNPVIYTILKDGIVIFDAGYFIPLQMLMQMGHIRPSKETVDKHMEIAREILKLGKDTMISKLVYDLEQAVVSSAQSVLMELGYRPPGPNEVPGFVQKVLVEENKFVDAKYAEHAEKVIRCFKDIEHKEKTTFTGKEWDEYLAITEDFVATMEKLLKKIREDKGETYLYESVEAKKSGKELKVERPTDVDVSKVEVGKNSEQIKEELGQR